MSSRSFWRPLVGARGGCRGTNCPRIRPGGRGSYHSLQVGHFYLLGGLLLGIGTACGFGEAIPARLLADPGCPDTCDRGWPWPWPGWVALVPAAVSGKRLRSPGPSSSRREAPVHLYQLRYDLSVLFDWPTPGASHTTLPCCRGLGHRRMGLAVSGGCAPRPGFGRPRRDGDFSADAMLDRHLPG